MQNIGQSVVKNLWLALPPLPEQIEICSHIAATTQPLRDAITRLEREIAALREYQTRLIADIVTGQLDVRDAAARLPDEVSSDTHHDDPEPTDDAEEEDIAEADEEEEAIE